MKSIEKLIARELLQINAIKLNPANPFVWASGWNSPIYCDNRKTLAYPSVRGDIRNAFCKLLKEEFPTANAIAGVATGAIAHGVLVAEALDMPFSYVRSAPKGHGLTNLIEGEIKFGQKVVVIEDLISTGASSLAAVEALRNAGCDVLGMMAIFTYGFPQAQLAFEKAGCKLVTLSNYEVLIPEAIEMNYVDSASLETLGKWRNSPETWNK
ncbi:orotate phosphoribosyltransferase [Williamwhitmania taraxaci]|uniref:Orotate phosphoribosyltransferase n=1 Tax=Williamwhitmania taraxaci TaxID=1640674 RepID=A0A1G6LD62_9BACT|nr:orotate phosphoribosyltransferase [Williamwhitmania taraxaci]SDC41219.1 orotate phosphoribosyltransferase [Williamwhitmania taraxaci]